MTIELRSVASSQTIEMNFHEVNKAHMHFLVEWEKNNANSLFLSFS